MASGAHVAYEPQDFEPNPGFRAAHRGKRKGFGRRKLDSVLAILDLDDAAQESEHFLRSWPLQDGLAVAVDASLAIVVLAEDPRCIVADAPELAEVLLLAAEFRDQAERVTYRRLIAQ
jgi:hypothetical protein